MDALDCMRTRRSIRQFDGQPVPKEILEQIVDCGRLAASAINIQPWRFVVVTDSERLRQIAEITDHGKFIAEAGACIIVFCRGVKYYIEDGSAATQNMLNAARALGIASCWVAGDKKPYVAQLGRLLGAPDEFRIVSLLALGYSSADPSPEKLPLSEVIRWESFG